MDSGVQDRALVRKPAILPGRFHEPTRAQAGAVEFLRRQFAAAAEVVEERLQAAPLSCEVIVGLVALTSSRSVPNKSAARRWGWRWIPLFAWPSSEPTAWTLLPFTSATIGLAATSSLQMASKLAEIDLLNAEGLHRFGAVRLFATMSLKTSFARVISISPLTTSFASPRGPADGGGRTDVAPLLVENASTSCVTQLAAFFAVV